VTERPAPSAGSLMRVTESAKMSYTAIIRDQFEVTRNEVRHMPTGASFRSYPGLDKVVASVKWGECGCFLPSGESYSSEDVEAMARSLMAEHASVR
jgi:hypothetical protein